MVRRTKKFSLQKREGGTYGPSLKAATQMSGTADLQRVVVVLAVLAQVEMRNFFFFFFLLSLNNNGSISLMMMNNNT